MAPPARYAPTKLALHYRKAYRFHVGEDLLKELVARYEDIGLRGESFEAWLQALLRTTLAAPWAQKEIQRHSRETAFKNVMSLVKIEIGQALGVISRKWQDPRVEIGQSPIPAPPPHLGEEKRGED